LPMDRPNPMQHGPHVPAWIDSSCIACAVTLATVRMTSMLWLRITSAPW
jgi:hypothetical protein